MTWFDVERSGSISLDNVLHRSLTMSKKGQTLEPALQRHVFTSTLLTTFGAAYLPIRGLITALNASQDSTLTIICQAQLHCDRGF